MNRHHTIFFEKSWTYIRKWEWWENKRYENYEWKNESFVDSVRCKLNPVERDVNSRMNSFIFRGENWVCLASAQKWSLFVLFVFLLLPRLENWVAGKSIVSILCYNRAQPANVEITSFIMDSRSICACRAKNNSSQFPYFSFQKITAVWNFIALRIFTVFVKIHLRSNFINLYYV